MQGFKYDKLGRLLNITEYPSVSGGSTTNYSQTYTYDRFGNKRQEANGTLGLPAVSERDYQNSNNDNRFVSTVASYDDNGNVTQDFKFHAQTYAYAYDANGRQTSASNGTWTEAQVYDCSGQRVQTSVDGVTRTMIYDIFGQNIADYNYVGSGLERENFYRAGQLLATREFPTTQNVVWTNATGVSVSGNSITKAGSTGWGQSGAVSTQAIVSGDGYAEFTADSLDYGMYGLSHDNPDLHYTGIDYAIYTERAEGRVYVYENGTSRGQVGTWTSGDRFSVAVEGGVVKYKKNNTVLYTSSVSPTYPLFVDTSLYNGNTLSNVVISGDFTGAGLRYVLQDIQGTARVVMSNSSAVKARHDYLPFGEVISGGIGSRNGMSEYTSADGNRWNYGLTERDTTSGLDHTWFRKYESRSGRWTSPDPYNGSMNLGDSQSFDRYSYVLNDPVNFVDPTGLHFERICYTIWIGVGDGYIVRRVRCERNWVDDGPFLGVDGDGSQAGTPPKVQTPAWCEPEVQRAINRAKLAMVSSGGAEYGYRVDNEMNKNGKLERQVSGEYTSGSGEEVNVKGITKGVTAAVVHTHSRMGIDPSKYDRTKAKEFNYLSIVVSTSGVSVFNPNDPKDPKGKPKFLRNPSCPK